MASLSERQREFTRMAVRLMAYALSFPNVEIRLVEVTRAPCRQKELVAAGKSWTRHSLHLHGLAMDIFLWLDGKLTWNWEDYLFLGEYWEKLGGVWGGRWKTRDAVHFQYGGKRHVRKSNT